MKSNLGRALAPLICVMLLSQAGCGGGSSSPSPSSSAMYTVGGTVSGLDTNQSVTLGNSGGDTVALAHDGSFSFPTSLGSGSAYDVTVQSHTSGISCSVSNGSGTVGSANVVNIVVSCAPLIPYTVGGTVSGLSANESVTLLDNGGDAVAVSGDGAFTFPTALLPGSAFQVTVKSHTPAIACPVSNGSGTVGSSNVVTVVVSCGAGSETVLHSFGSSATDGVGPEASLIMDSAGNLYGTTEGGGAKVQGTVFKINAAGTESVLYSFGSSGTSDGSAPTGPLIMDNAGELYGTTFSGGAYSYYGTVFEISANGSESIVYSFSGITTGDAGTPHAGLIMDSAGNLYGTGYTGGTNNDGAVFRISAAGTESVLYSFPVGANDIANPDASLVMDGAGNLYGTTAFGGANDGGTVFEITAAGSESVLYSFGNSPGDGWSPQAPLMMDSAGNLYGTTAGGGADSGGTVFRISASGTESILYSFGGSAADGVDPRAGLIMDSGGNLYGTTAKGGANSDGTVFKISAAGGESVLYSFGGGTTDGAAPFGGLIADSAGNLYGTTYSGGANNDGTVFKID